MNLARLHPMMATCGLLAAILVVGVLSPQVRTRATEPASSVRGLSEEEREYFERHIRPVLVERCYECHNTAETQEGGLALDHRQALLDGGFSGAAIKPGQPQSSLLIEAIRQEGELRMPEDGPQLAPDAIGHFERWVSMGAPDPRDAPPTAKELREVTSWAAVRKKRMQWWSFQPVVAPSLPPATDWSDHPVDRFMAARWQDAGLGPAPESSRHEQIRRLSFILTGLPPTPQQVQAFIDDRDPRAYERLVDRLLDSPAFGERWARHWMDWFRYAESHGSEGDPGIPFAWRYRDYLIRALNQDVGYDQLVREHLAGDLLQQPRLSPDGRTNESMLGVAHYRFVQHGYAPTDALDEQVRFTENQIDVLTKAFQGLTVSCARCHDHKFDAISQADFYALYGVMVSCRPALLTVDSEAVQKQNRDQLQSLKLDIRATLGEQWRQWILDGRLRQQLVGNQAVSAEELAAARKDPLHPLHTFAVLSQADDKTEAWKALQAAWESSRQSLAQRANTSYPLHWQLAARQQDGLQEWPHHGSGLRGELVAEAGAFTVSTDANKLVDSIYPAGVYSHLVSNKHSGLLTSPDFDVEMDQLWVRVLGGNNSRIRYAMQHYPRVSGPVYRAHDLTDNRYRWLQWDMRYWQGDQAYLEIATAADLPVEARSGNERAWFGVTEVVGLKQGQPQPKDEPYEYQAALLTAADDSSEAPDVSALYERAALGAIEAWRDEKLDDSQARFLSGLLSSGLLPNTPAEVGDQVAALVKTYQKLEQEIAVPRRAPGIIEGRVRNQPLFVRGNHKQPSDPVQRRFLEALDDTAFPTETSGRLHVADRILDPQNPFTSRVIVNRVWHHVFGRGLVASPDNFGRLGESPTHPELLDYLAATFPQNDYSLKALIRLMVTSRTFRQSTVPAAAHAARVAELDPGNDLLSHMPVRRIEAEAIRDALLLVSGRLDPTVGGPPAGESSSRRSIYVEVRRNALSQFLAAFDAPVPFSTKGARNVTNVPAQSLTLLNDPFVQQLAETWARSVSAEVGSRDGTDTRKAIRAMYKTAFAREPSDEELEAALSFLQRLTRQRESAAAKLSQIRQRIGKIEQQIAAIEQPVRSKLLAEQASQVTPEANLEPFAEWSFDDNLNDHIRGIEAKPVGSAHIEDGKLVLDGNSYVMSGPLPKSIAAKTLEAWVQLADLDQRAGGVVTIQTLNGVIFDSIVYAEKDPRQWMAGSNNFRRTQTVGGPAETERGTESPLHVAIVYDEDGSITLYRDGKPYGKSYQSDGPVTFEAGQAQVLFGLRHGTPNGRRGPLRGAIDRARIYDRALTAEEIAASAAGAPYVSRREVRQALDESERKTLEELDQQVARLRAEASNWTELAAGPRDNPLADLALALFNFKEFIYLR